MLPLIISTLAALAIAPALLRFLRENGHVRLNYRDAEVASPLGLVLPAAALAALIPLALLHGLWDSRTLDAVPAGLLVLGAGADMAEQRSRGHSRPVR